MKKIALLPGTFDPPTLGHLDLIRRGAAIVDELIVAIAIHPEKHSAFTDEEKIDMLGRIVPRHIEVASFSGLIIDFAKKRKASFLIRGLRTFSDFEFEDRMAQANRKMSGIETIFLTADDAYSAISSSLIREIAYFQGSLKGFVPEELELLIQEKYLKKES